MLSFVLLLVIFFFFNDTATTEIYSLSLHDALPIYPCGRPAPETSEGAAVGRRGKVLDVEAIPVADLRSEEHTSELQSQSNLVCRLLLEKKNKKYFSISAHQLTSQLQSLAYLVLHPL